MGVMPELILKWEGKDYRCRVTMDVIMHIENKITLGDLASRAMDASINGGHTPSSHISWVMYCLLVGGGASVTADSVFAAIKSCKSGDSTEQAIISTVQFVIGEVYGTGPEEPEEDSGGEKKT